MKRFFFLLILSACAVVLQAQTIEEHLYQWLDNYLRWDANITPPTLRKCDINKKEKTITVTIGGGFQEQHFTPEVVDSIYSRGRSFVPEEYRSYDLAIMTEDHRIEDLVPNFFRRGNIDRSRLWKEEYKGEPWVRNTSRPYSAPGGLEGTHLSLWQSHGRYWNTKKYQW